MKITREYLKALIKESLQEADLTDLEAVGAEEAYSSDDEEEVRHVRGMLSKEREINVDRIDVMMADLATLASTFKQQNGDPQVLQLIEDSISNLQKVQTLI
jgi:hypothetical protein